MRAKERWRNRAWFRWRWAGLTVGIVFFCLSLTPSLLPRGALLQGFIGGVNFAIGYGLGILGRWMIYKITQWRLSDDAMRIAWWVLAGVSVVLVGTFLYLGREWQREIHELVGLDAPAGYSVPMILVVAVLIATGLIALGRVLRRFSNWISRLVDRWVPRGVATVTGVVVVILVVALAFEGIIFNGLVSLSNSMFKQINAAIDEDITEPETPLVSGGPESLVAWDTLGSKGREFVAGEPSIEMLTEFSGEEATQPIRVYTGLNTASSVDERIDLAVDELERTDALEREALLVVTTTGTGWVDPAGFGPLEYMYNGDIATVSTQYSYLPSVISFLVDKSKASEAGRELFNAVYNEWSQLPENDRPKLLVFGESLGSFGAEAAFSGVDDMRNRTDGVLLVGPTASNELWRRFENNRDEGSPEWLPVFEDGETIRFASQPEDLDNPDAPWDEPRVVYLQHASDPIDWWTPELILSEPDWLTEPAGRDRLGSMRWFPFVTFWQVTADMPFANGVPAGHGHKYGDATTAAWAAIAEPPGWTDEDTERLTPRFQIPKD